jgi:hypothetical protein
MEHMLMMPTMPMMFSPGSPSKFSNFRHCHIIIGIISLYNRNPRQMGISRADDATRGSSAHHQHHQQNWMKHHQQNCGVKHHQQVGRPK